MNVLIVLESCFGNTAAIANAVADGLRERTASASVVDAASAPSSAAGYDLVCIGAPTHNLGLPSPASRAEAVRRGGSAPQSGVAEWLDGRPALAGTTVVAFDTALPGPFSGSAAKRIVGRLRGLRIQAAARESFAIVNSRLADGELDRARAWGSALASSETR